MTGRQAWRAAYHTTRHLTTRTPARPGALWCERRGGRGERSVDSLTLFPSRVLSPPRLPSSSLPPRPPRNHTLGLRMQNYASVINRGCYALDGAALANSLVYFHCSAPQGHTPRFSPRPLLPPSPAATPATTTAWPLRPSLPQPHLLPVLGYRHTPRPPPSPLRHEVIKMGIARPQPATRSPSAPQTQRGDLPAPPPCFKNVFQLLVPPGPSLVPVLPLECLIWE